MIFGIYGATRADEITKIELKDVTEQGSLFIIKILETKTKIIRTFIVEEEYAEFVRKYRNLRPLNTSTSRFFINYQNGKCFNQPIGRNKFLGIPKSIAVYLNLAEPQLYTGHSFRRTSATLLADAGGDILTLKRHAGWRSSSAAEGYVQDSIASKRKIGGLIAGQIKLPRTESNMPTSTIISPKAELTDGSEESTISPNAVLAHGSEESTITCTQSIVSILRSSDVAIDPPKPVPAIPLDDNHHMQFNNCTVSIYMK